LQEQASVQKNRQLTTYIILCRLKQMLRLDLTVGGVGIMWTVRQSAWVLSQPSFVGLDDAKGGPV
jgi:hypothetical protein